MSAEDAGRITLEAYLRQVRHGLRGLPSGEAQEVVDELRSHVIDRADGAPLTLAAVDAAIAGLGPARDLAGLYVAERMAERVEVSRSPWLILQTVWRLAGLSLRAFFTLMVSLIGYALGIGLVITGAAKPFIPNNDGLWFRSRPSGFTMSLSITDNPTGQELLGWWLIPIGLIGGAVVLWLTWRFGLAGVRKLGRARAEILTRKG